MSDPIVVSLATIPRRTRSLARTVDSLLPQCDRLNVYLNGHARVPEFLLHDKIVIARSADHGDRGDAGKFWWSDKLVGPAYHLTTDDDLLYPSDYCATLIRKIEQLKRRAVIGVHGVVLNPKVRGKYYGDRRVYPCLSNLAYDVAVHVLGTGALGYHTSTLTVRPQAFRRPNMADIWFGILAKRQRVPMICISHARGWLVDLGDPEPEKCIASTHKSHNGIQAAALREVNPWPAPLTLDGIRRGAPKRAAQGNVPASAAAQLERANPESGREFGARKVEAGVQSTAVKRKIPAAGREFGARKVGSNAGRTSVHSGVRIKR